jgi:hypothetical protein
MEKPKKPIEPNIHDYPIPSEPNGKNSEGQPIFQRLDYIRDRFKYEKQLVQYKLDVEVFEQIKLIKLVKHSTEKYCLKNIRINKLS